MGIVNGVGIHGTGEDWSIGSRASHGCIRMHVSDVIDLSAGAGRHAGADPVGVLQRFPRPVGAWAIGTFATERAEATDAPEAAAVSRAAAAPFSPRRRARAPARDRQPRRRRAAPARRLHAGLQARPHAERQVGRRAEEPQQRLLREPRVRELVAADGGRPGDLGEFDDKPIAKEHLDWYLTKGKGADLVENANIEKMLRSDRGVQAMIETRMPSPWPTTGKWATDFKVEQSDYVDQDLRFAFGAIDRLDIEVDFDAKTITGWFQDRYEWHPVYAGLYKKLARR